jgi:protein-disulfide isomerase
LQAVLAAQPDVRLVVKEFPILAETSVLAAKAAIAAQRQGKFEDFHIAMMTWRGRIDADAIDSAGREAGLDPNRLRLDMEDELTAAILTRTRSAAAALEIRGTPALIIGEAVIPGAISKNEIFDLINQARTVKN